MKKIILILLIGIFINTGCKKDYDVHIKGRVLDIATNEPLANVEVRAVDGYPDSGWLFGGGGIDETGIEQTVYTNENGEFEIKIEGENTCYIFLSKGGYWRNQEQQYAAEYPSRILIGNYNEDITLYLQNAVDLDLFFKKKEPCNETDSLIVTALPYDNAYFFRPDKSYFKGCDFHYFFQEFSVGGLYFRYKLEYTEGGVWKNKLDSIFVDSHDNKLDTIYY